MKHSKILAVLAVSTFLLAVISLAITRDLKALTSPAKNKADMFHVVFVVAADNVVVGEQASVEPIFITDGKELIPFYDYCRILQSSAVSGSEDYQRKTHAKLERYKIILAHHGIFDIDALKPFCYDKTFTVTTKDYFVLDNLGQGIRIGSTLFETSQLKRNHRTTQLSPVMSLSGITTIAAVENTRRNLLKYMNANTRGRHYFFMSTDKATLEAIVPVQIPTVQTAAILLTNANALAKDKQGMVVERCPKGKCTTRWRQESAKKSVVSNTNEFDFISPLYADFDGDSKTDLAVYIRSKATTQRKGYHGSQRWIALGLAFSGDRIAMEMARFGSEERWESPVINNFPNMDPVGLIRLGACSFLLTPIIDLGSGHIGFNYNSVPRENNNCEDMFAAKVVPIL